jgi:menaquinone-dependent protoporphyrinogen oxidase
MARTMHVILLAYASSEGQTKKIAERISLDLQVLSVAVEVVPIADAPINLDQYDAVLVGASIHVGKHPPEAVEFVQAHRARLAATPSAFFSVSLAAADHDDEHQAQAQRYVQEFFDQVDWHPELVGCFGGALRYTQYGFVKKLIVRHIAKTTDKATDTHHDHEYTDWDDVDHFTQAFATHLGFDLSSERSDRGAARLHD